MPQTKRTEAPKGNLITEEIEVWLPNGIVRFGDMAGHGHKQLMLFHDRDVAQLFSTLAPPRKATVTVKYKRRASDALRSDIISDANFEDED